MAAPSRRATRLAGPSWNSPCRWFRIPDAAGRMPMRRGGFGDEVRPANKFRRSTVDERHDVVIVGGGIMGATTLYEFARRGVDALLLEQDPEFGGRDSSKTAGLMRTHYSNPVVVRMAIRGQQVFREIAALASVEKVFQDIGYAFLCPADALARARDNVAMQREQGANVVELPPSDLHRFAPGASRDEVAAIFYEPDSGYVEPV